MSLSYKNVFVIDLLSLDNMIMCDISIQNNAIKCVSEWYFGH